MTTYRILLIEPAAAPPEAVFGPLSAGTGWCVERATWDAVPLDVIRGCHADLILAVAIVHTQRTATFFQWLRQHPSRMPAVAIVADIAGEAADCAVAVVDDFLLCPVRAPELRQRVTRLLGPERGSIESVQQALAEEVGLSQLVGNAPVFTQMLHQLPLFAAAAAPVLMTGETGTGKELCARALHHLSRRRHAPFVPVDCAAVPDHLFENELFGHARGAFTDAHREHKGLIALAEGGTVFLDEVDALSLAAQAKLLRLLQERTFKPLGAEQVVRADIAVMAATNRDLDDAVQAGRFRRDLYFRLNVLRLELPPLRRRRSDIPVLAAHFLAQTRMPGRPRSAFSASALRLLGSYDWPGNVRELQNVVQRAVVVANGGPILPVHLAVPGAAAPAPSPESFRRAKADVVATFERGYVDRMLAKHAGNVTHAAREAHLDRRAFGRLAKRHAISRHSL